MGSRYIITGVQMGMVLGHLKVLMSDDVPLGVKSEILEETKEIINEVLIQQYIGSSSNTILEDANYLLKKGPIFEDSKT